ncbi:MAG: glucosamine-6-phosphate deaminase [Peptostreptococcaceae bacterium]|nr:glucosamine-6-phosphate deaminase [Peptostreptococcaceae bacterium]
MRIITVNDYEEMSLVAARFLAAQLLLKPSSVLGLATGSTPEGMYAHLVRMYEQEGLDFSRATCFNLDEYLGLSSDHPQSYHFYMERHLFSKVNLPPTRRRLPETDGKDPELSCLAYEKEIAQAGGIDLQVLGIGVNGHIGFNEPDDKFTAATHIVDLEESTIEANARFFGSRDEVPRRAMTMGVGSIFKAEKILLLASGASKAKAVHEALRGAIRPQLPASILQLHSQVICIIDREAASLLR